MSEVLSFIAGWFVGSIGTALVLALLTINKEIDHHD